MSVNQMNHCPNCSAELHGPYCSSCGQRQVDLERPLRELAGEAMDAFLSFDSRILKTLASLITKPGLLTVEFLEGRQRRSIHPFKLYFAISVALFLALSFSGFYVVRVGGDDDVAVTTSGLTTSAEFKESRAEEVPTFLDDTLGPLAAMMQNDPQRLNQIFTDRLAKAVVILVPVFALLLKFLYWKRHYAGNLVFSLHLHSFAFLAILVGIAIDLALGSSKGEGPGDGLSVVAIAVYTFLALRTVYGQGRLITVAKMVVLFVCYLVAVIVTMILALALTAVTI